ncbi:F-box domain protein [Oesophagostomum dentatum]|uniref:F-box domain protein n=1 Tax=Oesophagostomum dentatum TaxID=61180 RepID=A0A0B1TGY3_OESDE|nr:F-box domain protein [Oesophagostomum dentatum]
MEDENFLLSSGPDAFVSEFSRWSELSPELKVKILRYLPVQTVDSFKFLSKECLSLASRVPTEIYSVYLKKLRYYSLRNRGYVEKSMFLIVNGEEISFADDGSNGCIVERAAEEEKNRGLLPELQPHYPNEIYQSVAMRTFFQLTRNARITKLHVGTRLMDEQLERILEEQPKNTKITCKLLLVSTNDTKFLLKFLPFITPGCALATNTGCIVDPIEFYMDSACFDLAVMRTTPHIQIDDVALAGITDDQLSRVRATRIITRAPRISSCGINHLILQWVNGKRSIIKISLKETRSLDVDSIVEGVDPSYLVSEEELLESRSIRKILELVPCTGFRGGLRNKSGCLLTLDVYTNSCVIFNPYLQHIQWFREAFFS